MIWAKKRFEVLKRDWFRCTYCWRNWKDVTLEVDHIIPKKDWWHDTMENLTTACRECNIWKWWDVIDNPSKNLYKHKIQELENRVRADFYAEWNTYEMWTIDDNTRILLSFYIKHTLSNKWSYYYETMLNYPPLYWENSPYWKDRHIDHQKMNILFQQWWKFCDDVLDCIYWEFYECDFKLLVEECLNDEDWTPKNNKDKERFSSRLNYKLTEYMWDNEDISKYFLYKYSLYHNLLEDE